MRARWYDPATGQFITIDPIGHASAETNLYRYAGGDPLNASDPSGLLFGIPRAPSIRNIVEAATGFAEDVASTVTDIVDEGHDVLVDTIDALTPTCQIATVLLTAGGAAVFGPGGAYLGATAGVTYCALEALDDLNDVRDKYYSGIDSCALRG